MVANRLVHSTGSAFSAFLTATVVGAVPTGAASPGTNGPVVADHGWSQKAAEVPASIGGLTVLVDGTEDHGWG